MNELKYAPVVVFTYNRAGHTELLLKSLNTARDAQYTDLFIFSDGALSPEQSKEVNDVREVIDDFIANKSVFRKVEVTKSPKNNGLANSIISGVTKIIQKYGQVIVLEDDLQVSVDFLEYMNSALTYYKENQTIWAISGYTFAMKSLENYHHDIYIAMRGCSWGWATWIDRWEKVDWEVKDYDNIKFNWKNRLEFGRWGRDMPFMLDANIYGLNHSWAIRWCYSAYKQKQYTVYPCKSRVKNNGTDGSGTNYTKAIKKYDTVLTDGNNSIHFENVLPDKNIELEFQWKTKKLLGFIRDHFKWMMIKTGMIKASK